MVAFARPWTHSRGIYLYGPIERKPPRLFPTHESVETMVQLVWFKDPHSLIDVFENGIHGKADSPPTIIHWRVKLGLNLGSSQHWNSFTTMTIYWIEMFKIHNQVSRQAQRQFHRQRVESSRSIRQLPGCRWHQVQVNSLLRESAVAGTRADGFPSVGWTRVNSNACTWLTGIYPSLRRSRVDVVMMQSG